MSFANWKNKSKLFTAYAISCPSLERVAEAAYKAGQREAEKRMVTVCENAILLREKLKSGT